tara:strand:- start:1993 stop:2748 length:756 start_codon:yes stop_codon:yes gene_type:complete
MEAHDKIFELIYSKDEVTWQRLLYELVKSENMNPWDINISMLTKKYIEIVKKLKELDFRVSGKVLLAAAILLKLKSTRLLNEDLSDFDRLLTETEEDLPDGLDLEEVAPQRADGEKVPLIPRTPQPRKRKVSIHDLVDALEKAFEVKQRRVLNSIPPMNLTIPKKSKDITEVIKEVYGNIKSFFYKNNKNKVMFSQLIPSETKEGRVFTFIPLLHLTTQRKIDIEQQEHFGDIEIMLNSKKDISKELESET